jgi:hypothetical protein
MTNILDLMIDILSLVISLKDFDFIYVGQLSAPVHSLCGSDFACSMKDSISFRDLFFCSATSFFCGVYRTMCCN